MGVGDVGLALRAMGAFIENKEIKILIQKYDPDRTGKIGRDDYINMLAEVDLQPNNSDDVMDTFTPFDPTNQGMINLEEMQHVLSRVGDTLSPDEMANFIGMIDNYGDGYARMNDLVNVVIPAE